MIVVAVDRLAVPNIVGGVASVLHLVAVAVGLETLGDNGATARVHVGEAVPSHGAGGSVDGAEEFQFDAGLGDIHHLGPMSDASLIPSAADKNVAHLGTVGDSVVAFHSRREYGVHYGAYLGSFFNESQDLFPLVAILVLARITAFALLGLMGSTAQIDARGEHAANFD